MVVLAALLLASPARAYLTKVTVGMQIEAGFYCDFPTDRSEPAPHTQEGRIGLYENPFPLVHLGDLVPAAPGIAIGINARLSAFTPGEILIVRARRIEDPSGVNVWQMRLPSDGRFWISTSPRQGYGLPYGHYEFSVLRGFSTLLVYEFQVMPVELVPDLKSPCHAQLS